MSRTATPSEVLQEATIVDADVHLSIDTDDLAARLDEPHRSRVGSGYGYPATNGADWDPYMGGKIESRSLDSPETIREDLVEEFHVDYPILNTISGLARMPDTDLAIALMSAYNDVLIEKFLDPTDYHGLALITTQDPEAAAEEIDRVADEDGIVGIFLYATTPDTPLGDPEYDPMYRAAEDNDMTVAYHAGAATSFRYQFPNQNQGLEEFLSVHTLTHPYSQMLVLTSLIVQGVPEKFPGLNFVFLEAGLGWVPYMTWRLNKEYAIRRSEAPLLEKTPEEYIEDQFYFASQPLGEPNDPAEMKAMIDLVGTDSIMFASDYPHWDFDHPSELGNYLASMYEADEREQVLSGTPAEAFGIEQ